MAWPRLREEIDVFEGAVLADGQPSWVLHDPVRNQFFRIDWLTFEILSRWRMGNAQAILHAVARDTTLHPDGDDLERLLKFLNEQQLLANDDPKTARDMAERVAGRARVKLSRDMQVSTNEADDSPVQRYRLDVSLMHECGFRPALDIDGAVDDLLSLAIDTFGTPS